MIGPNYDRLQSGHGNKEKYIRKGRGCSKKLQTGRLRSEFCTLTLQDTNFDRNDLKLNWSVKAPSHEYKVVARFV